MTPSERLKIARNFYPKGSRIKSFKIDKYNAGESRDEIVDEGQNMKTYEEYDYSISTPNLKGFIYDAVEDEWARLLDSNGTYIGLPKGLLSYLGMDASMKDASSKYDNFYEFIIGKSPRYNPDTFEKIVSSQSKTNTNGKEHPKIGSVIEVRRPVATISRGARPRGSAVPGRRREVTTSVGHLSHKPSFIRG